MTPETAPLVLCVDDDARTLEILAKLFSHLPVRPVMSRDPYEAITLAARLQPDLLVLDLMMPGIDGWQILERIRQEPWSARLRVLVLTAKDSPAERLLATNVARVDAFMGKPFQVADLARLVLRLLHLPVGEAWPGPGAGEPAAP
jgi:CheY-like chemotaxis protein